MVMVKAFGYGNGGFEIAKLLEHHKVDYLGVAFAAFAISMVWSYNIKKIVFGTFSDRIFYSIGATIGSLLGLYTSSFIMNFFNNL